jgi:transposase-like protein
VDIGRLLAANNPERDPARARTQLIALYRKHRSGRRVAAAAGVNHGTLKRWLRQLEESGYPLPESEKGTHATRGERWLRNVRTAQKKRRSRDKSQGSEAA